MKIKSKIDCNLMFSFAGEHYILKGIKDFLEIENPSDELVEYCKNNTLLEVVDAKKKSKKEEVE